MKIRPDGNVSSCDFVNEIYGNIREKDFEKMWNSKKARNFRKKIKKQLLPQCRRCCKLTLVNKKNMNLLKKLAFSILSK